VRVESYANPTFSPDPRKSLNAKDVVAEFKATGYEPEAYTLYSHKAPKTLADAATQAGSTNGKKGDITRSNALQDH
jgi:branched-chain amino acid transport system substrate-binding protein